MFDGYIWDHFALVDLQTHPPCQSSSTWTIQATNDCTWTKGSLTYSTHISYNTGNVSNL